MSDVMSEAQGHGKNHGFTVIELIVVLVVIAIISAAIVPLAVDAIRDARITNAQSDVAAIGKAIVNMEKDLGRFPMFTSAAIGSGNLQDNDANVVRLDGPGALPTETVVSAWTSGSPSDDDPGGACATASNVDTLADQLLSNGPGYSTSAQPAKPFQWRGSYLERIDEDPWEHRYLVNIINVNRCSDDAAFVLSAGPDGRVDTPFDSPEISILTPGGDDIVFRIK